MNLCELLQATDGVLLQGDARVSVQGLCYDSRAVTPGSLFVCLPGLHTGQHRFGGLKGFQTAITLLFGLLRRAHGIVNSATDGAGERHGEPAFLLLEGFIPGALVVPRLDDDAVAAEA